jgi:hypothetical protein
VILEGDCRLSIFITTLPLVPDQQNKKHIHERCIRVMFAIISFPAIQMKSVYYLFMRTIFFYLILSFLQIAIAEDCNQNRITNQILLNKLDRLDGPFKSYECNLQSSINKCETLKESLPIEDQDKIIQCDLNSVITSQLSDLDLNECVIGTLKLKIKNLVSLTELPGKLIEIAAKNADDANECNNSDERKIELITLFNLGVSQKRYHFPKAFIENNLLNLTCLEIRKLIDNRRHLYFNEENKKVFQYKINSQNYQLPKDVIGNDDPNMYSNMLSNFIKENKSKYECYSPKAKAEIICSVVTSFVADALVGYGAMKITNSFKQLVLKDFGYSAQKNLIKLSTQQNIPKKLIDVSPQAETAALKHFSADNFKDFDYGDLSKCLKKCIDKVKDGTQFSNLYKTNLTSPKVNTLLSDIKKMNPGENPAKININGENVDRIIVGLNPNAPIAIIGRGHGRVKGVQVAMNSESFSPSKVAVKLLEEKNDISLMLEENRKWIQSVKDRGMTILDLGMGNNIETSPFYQIELGVVQKYIKNK